MSRIATRLHRNRDGTIVVHMREHETNRRVRADFVSLKDFELWLSAMYRGGTELLSDQEPGEA